MLIFLRGAWRVNNRFFRTFHFPAIDSNIYQICIVITFFSSQNSDHFAFIKLPLMDKSSFRIRLKFEGHLEKVI